MARSTGAPYAATKLRNDLVKLDPKLKIELKNIRVNGALFGCSGFITDPSTGVVVYINTDHNHGTMYDRALYRTAKNNRDYTGGHNNTSNYASLAQNAVELLRRSGKERAAAEAAPREGSSWHGTGAKVDWDRLGVKNPNAPVNKPAASEAVASRGRVCATVRARVSRVTVEGKDSQGNRRYALWTDVFFKGKPRVFTATGSPASAQAAQLREELSRGPQGAVVTVGLGMTINSTVYSINR